MSAGRGDGFIAHANKHLTAGTGTERHNYELNIRNCRFDGVSEDQRNAISVIDCDGFVRTEFIDFTVDRSRTSKASCCPGRVFRSDRPTRFANRNPISC